MGLTNYPELEAEWQVIAGQFGPVNETEEPLLIQVQCVGTPNADGLYEIYIDDVVLDAI